MGKEDSIDTSYVERRGTVRDEGSEHFAPLDKFRVPILVQIFVSYGEISKGEGRHVEPYFGHEYVQSGISHSSSMAHRWKHVMVWFGAMHGECIHTLSFSYRYSHFQLLNTTTALIRDDWVFQT